MSTKILSFVILCGVAGLSCGQTTVVGPSNTAYVRSGESASFNCRVTWATDAGVHSIQWGRGRYRDDEIEWTDVAQCFEIEDGTCNIPNEFQNSYSVQTAAPYDSFTLTVDPATLAEDGFYDCWPYDDTTPQTPHARLVVLNQVSSVSIQEFYNRRTVKAGESVATECLATSGNPAAELSWKIGNMDISSMSNSTATETGDETGLYDTRSVLVYAFNASDDQQLLKCESFQHRSLTAKSSQILMNVEHPPVIQAIVVVSWEGYRVVVECLASANPGYIVYSWESDDGQYGGDSRTWELTDENGDGEVIVTCTATNREETDQLREIVKKPRHSISSTGSTPISSVGIPGSVSLAASTKAFPLLVMTLSLIMLVFAP